MLLSLVSEDDLEEHIVSNPHEFCFLVLVSSFFMCVCGVLVCVCMFICEYRC